MSTDIHNRRRSSSLSSTPERFGNGVDECGKTQQRNQHQKQPQQQQQQVQRRRRRHHRRRSGSLHAATAELLRSSHASSDVSSSSGGSVAAGSSTGTESHTASRSGSRVRKRHVSSRSKSGSFCSASPRAAFVAAASAHGDDCSLPLPPAPPALPPTPQFALSRSSTLAAPSLSSSASASPLLDGDVFEVAAQQRRLLVSINSALNAGQIVGEQRYKLMVDIDALCSTPLPSARASRRGSSDDALAPRRLSASSLRNNSVPEDEPDVGSLSPSSSSSSSVSGTPRHRRRFSWNKHLSFRTATGGAAASSSRSSPPSSPLSASRRALESVESSGGGGGGVADAGTDADMGILTLHLGERGDAVQLQQKIGCGASGVVYRATVQGVTLACKVYENAADLFVDAQLRCSRHAMMSAALNRVCALRHEHVVRHFGWRRTPGDRVMLFMELCDCTLHDVIADARRRNAPLGSGVMLDYLWQIADGLVYVHHLCHDPMVHRDLKSDNIFVRFKNGASEHCEPGAGDVLKIGDFDEARTLWQPLAGNGDACKSSNVGEKLLMRSGRRSIKRQHSFNAGTFQFMAPEMIRDVRDDRLSDSSSSSSSSGSLCAADRYDERVDIWSFGMIVFEMLTLDVPYRHEQEQFVCNGGAGGGSGARDHVRQLIRRGVRPTLPPSAVSFCATEPRNAADGQIWSALVDLFTQCTSLRINDRPTASALRRHIEQLRRSFF